MIIPSVDENYWLKSLDSLSFEPANQNTTRVTKVFKTNE